VVATAWRQEPGVHPAVLPDTDLFRELGHLYETRLETLRHGSERALSTHSRWMRALECEYLRRCPQREINVRRLRTGAGRRILAGSGR
jgi:hypothetical protein